MRERERVRERKRERERECKIFLWRFPPRDGELVLVDAGCLYHGYISDVTRVWPVGGTFFCAQRDLYEAVLKVKQECIQVERSVGSCFSSALLVHVL